jgi:hypothetical protein
VKIDREPDDLPEKSTMRTGKRPNAQQKKGLLADGLSVSLSGFWGHGTVTPPANRLALGTGATSRSIAFKTGASYSSGLLPRFAEIFA